MGKITDIVELGLILGLAGLIGYGIYKLVTFDWGKFFKEKVEELVREAYGIRSRVVPGAPSYRELEYAVSPESGYPESAWIIVREAVVQPFPVGGLEGLALALRKLVVGEKGEETALESYWEALRKRYEAYEEKIRRMQGEETARRVLEATREALTYPFPLGPLLVLRRLLGST